MSARVDNAKSGRPSMMISWGLLLPRSTGFSKYQCQLTPTGRSAFPGAPCAVETRFGDDVSRYDLGICDKLRMRHVSRTTLCGSLSSRRPTNFVCRR
jgi:hypothetical protein